MPCYKWYENRACIQSWRKEKNLPSKVIVQSTRLPHGRARFLKKALEANVCVCSFQRAAEEMAFWRTQVVCPASGSGNRQEGWRR